ncbi:MAG: Rieske 2Fe-2S domain-containing protein [Dehalococcoidia bacterium]
MLSLHDNELLTRTAAGTPMGDLLRRFWVPALLSQEVPEADGPPVRVTLLGEDLVAFRQSDRRVGLVQARCPHRGAELFWGRNEECGLRCVYHGWKFDISGRCLEMPSEPPESRFMEKVSLTAYPTEEYGAMVWAYLGPPELPRPELPKLEFGLVPPERLFVSKKLQECNWAQAVEGAVDTAHFSFLHMPVEVPEGAPESVRWMKQDGSPRFTVVHHDAGMLIGASRRADEERLYWRITQFLVPNHSLAPGSERGQNMNGQTWVPIDDEHCWVYCYTWNAERDITEQERASMRRGFGIHSEVDERWVPVRRRANDYLIDRADQKTRSFTGIRGISEQDACIQDSQGPIYDRSHEHLGTTDVAIIEFRKLMLRMARDLREGIEPPQARRGEVYLVRSGSAVAPKEMPFDEVARDRVTVG